MKDRPPIVGLPIQARIAERKVYPGVLDMEEVDKHITATTLSPRGSKDWQSLTDDVNGDSLANDQKTKRWLLNSWALSSEFLDRNSRWTSLESEIDTKAARCPMPSRLLQTRRGTMRWPGPVGTLCRNYNNNKKMAILEASLKKYPAYFENSTA